MMEKWISAGETTLAFKITGSLCFELFLVKDIETNVVSRKDMIMTIYDLGSVDIYKQVNDHLEYIIKNNWLRKMTRVKRSAKDQ